MTEDEYSVYHHGVNYVVVVVVVLLSEQVHGRSREQRYTKQADWEYIQSCVQAGSPMPVFGKLTYWLFPSQHCCCCCLSGNGDVLSYEDHNSFLERSGATGLMIAR